MTKLTYLEDPHNYQLVSQIQQIGSDTKGSYVILKESPFYPQSGGQPSDEGSLESGLVKRKIQTVRYFEKEVRHYLQSDCPFSMHQEVNLKVDKEKRLLNTRYHTAGHLIASLTENLQTHLIPLKGHQFPDEAYVEFEGTVKDGEILRDQLMQEIANQIHLEKKVRTYSIQDEQMKTLVDSLPYVVASSSKATLRVCEIEGFSPVPCGGTHSESLKDLKQIEIKKCKSKKGRTKISYALKN